jgi:two-component system phosphate regulon sensor histidine kinase PhoR
MFKSNSIFSRILISYILIFLVLISLIYFISFRLVKEQHLARLEESLVQQAKSTFQLIEYDLEGDNYSALQERVQQISETIQARITIIDIKGKVVLESDADPQEMENHKERYELRKALKGEIASAIRYSATIHEEMLYVAVPIIENNRITYVSRLSIPITEISLLLHDFRKGIQQASIILFLFALIVAYFYTKQLTKPILKLKEICYDISQGNLKRKVEIKSTDELEDFSKSFNLMAEKLATTISELENKSFTLENIINSINEVLWVQDFEGRLVLSNSSFQKLIKAKNYCNKYYWELIHDPEVKAIISKITPQSSDITTEIKLLDKWFILSSSKIDDKQVIFVLHNISELKETQQLKRDFIVNASHELRTPLTAIKGFVEHLIEDANPTQLKYLNIIDRNSERLIYLINDIQALAKLEQGPQLIVSKIKLGHFLDKTKSIFEDKLKKNNLSLDLSIPEDLPDLEVDKFKIEQVFVNLIDNAIRYTSQGRIVISARTHEDKMLISVKDSGEGIPKQHLSRIFERFYVADKSRNRKNGGTGLGLAIVKHIINLHMGSIYVKSELNKGSEFIIELPLKQDSAYERDK